MQKIPTLFRRDPDDMRRVLPEVTPGCEWVLAGEGVATRKYDGTCIRVDADGHVWSRREVKPGKTPPDGWYEVGHDAVTGKRVGWEPWRQSSFAKVLQEVLTARGDTWDDDATTAYAPGTYELCGPKIQGNPEGFDRHFLVRHGWAVLHPPELSYDGLHHWLTGPDWVGEGIVWHHPDGRMAKLKRRDFPQTNPEGTQR